VASQSIGYWSTNLFSFILASLDLAFCRARGVEAP
jgi:hypothetical protein